VKRITASEFFHDVLYDKTRSDVATAWLKKFDDISSHSDAVHE